MDNERAINLIKSIIPRCFAVKVNYNERKGKFDKRPAITDWQHVVDDVSSSHDTHVGFPLGRGTDFIVLDIDRRNPQRPDHTTKVDGVAYYEQHFGPVDAPGAIVVRTPSQGYHRYYLVPKEYREHIRSCTPLADVLIEVLGTGRFVTFGDGYNLLQFDICPMPDDMIAHFLGHATRSTDTASDRINQVIGGGAKLLWKVTHEGDSYKLMPSTSQCCVDTKHYHSQTEHSCIYVSETAVVLQCFSHGSKTLGGRLKRELQELYFDVDKSAGSVEQVVKDILAMVRDEHLAREDGYVMKRHATVPYIYEPLCTFEDFVQTRHVGYRLCRQHPKKLDDIMKYLTTSPDPGFPQLRRDGQILGFTNGLLYLPSRQWTPREACDDNCLPRHMLYHDYIPDRLETPLLDRIVRYQLETDDLYTYMLAFIGRLFFPVGKMDNYGLIPMITGDTGTGKSTLLNVICALFAPSKVAVFSGNHEVTFGLQAKYDKELIIAHEITEALTTRLSADLFKQIACGERVDIARKHQSSISLPWTAPLFLCGNAYLGYEDSGGSLSRRLALFRFDKYVDTKDSQLEAKILATELPALVAKSLLAYQMLREHVGDSSFWERCPPYFVEQTDAMKQDIDYLYMFLTLGPNENTWSSKSLYFRYVKDSCMLMEDFKKRFTNYMRYRHPQVRYRWRSDYSTFKRLGYEIVYTNICKACLTEARHGCCAAYNRSNRSKRYLIKHLLCVEEEPVDWREYLLMFIERFLRVVKGSRTAKTEVYKRFKDWFKRCYPGQRVADFEAFLTELANEGYNDNGTGIIEDLFCAYNGDLVHSLPS